MQEVSFLLIALFLPVFPLSMLFNALFARITQPYLRAALLLAWPAVGIGLYHALDPVLPPWLAPLALATALFYAFRLVAMREVGVWTGYAATSAWACLWLPVIHAEPGLYWYVAWFGVPFAVLALLVGGLERRFGAAYTGLYGGLAQTLPRFAGVLVATVLAVMATPVFPTFFSMLKMLLAARPVSAMLLLAVWVLWSWAGIRLLQGLVVGERSHASVDDLAPGLVWGFGVLMLVFTGAGLVMSGGV